MPSPGGDDFHASFFLATHIIYALGAYSAIKTRERAEELGDEIALAGQQVRGRLKAINDQLKAAVAEDAEVVHTTTHKMRQNMQMTATTKLVLLMGQYQDEQLLTHPQRNFSRQSDLSPKDLRQACLACAHSSSKTLSLQDRQTSRCGS